MNVCGTIALWHGGVCVGGTAKHAAYEAGATCAQLTQSITALCRRSQSPLRTFDLLGGSVLAEVDQALAAQLPGVFSPGVPPAFHANYLAAQVRALHYRYRLLYIPVHCIIHYRFTGIHTCIHTIHCIIGCSRRSRAQAHMPLPPKPAAVFGRFFWTFLV